MHITPVTPYIATKLRFHHFYDTLRTLIPYLFTDNTNCVDKGFRLALQQISSNIVFMTTN